MRPAPRAALFRRPTAARRPRTAANGQERTAKPKRAQALNQRRAKLRRLRLNERSIRPTSLPLRKFRRSSQDMLVRAVGVVSNTKALSAQAKQRPPRPQRVNNARPPPP